MMDEQEPHVVVTFGSIYEETPEGLYRMDRLRMWQQGHDKEMEALIGPRYKEIEQAMDDAFIRGTGSSY